MTDIPDDPADEIHVETYFGNYVATHDWQSERPLTQTLLDALDEVPTISLEDEDALYESVDVEALEPLFQRGEAKPDAEVRFGFQDCLVVVTGDGTITIQPDADSFPPRSRRPVSD